MIRAFVLACLALAASAQTNTAVCGDEFLTLVNCALGAESNDDTTDDMGDLCDTCLDTYFDNAGPPVTCAQADKLLTDAFDNCSDQCVGENDPCGEPLRNYYKCVFENAVDNNCNGGVFIDGNGTDSGSLAQGLVSSAVGALLAGAALMM